MEGDGETERLEAASSLALAIEEDLRLVKGIVTVLIHLGQGTDPIEPGAIAALAYSAHEPMTRMIALQRAATRVHHDIAAITQART